MREMLKAVFAELPLLGKVLIPAGFGLTIACIVTFYVVSVRRTLAIRGGLREFADEVGGRYIPGRFVFPSGFEARFGNWTMRLDKWVNAGGEGSPRSFTRLRALYESTSPPWYVWIRRKGLANVIWRATGHRIDTGYADFDAAYDIFTTKDSDPQCIKAFLTSEGIRDLLHKRPKFILAITNRDQGGPGISSLRTLPRGVCELSVMRAGFSTDKEEMRDMLNLGTTALRHLHNVGLASDQSPNVSLSR